MLHRGKIQALLVSGNKDDVLIGIQLIKKEHYIYNMHKLIDVMDKYYEIKWNYYYGNSICRCNHREWIFIGEKDIFN